MDLSEALVDLLLVRLGREEERQRVLELLVSELRMSREDARKAVDSSPTVLMEAVAMGQARVIQNRLYPFIDLLPRMDSVTADEGLDTAAADKSARESPPEPEHRPASQQKPARVREKRDDPEPDMEIIDDKPSTDGQEEVGVTSASEEMLSVERCHVCGRTPTSGEKLAPCRSCAELTCRDCFDRVAHVCQKCSADGKVVSAPLSTHSRSPQSRAGQESSLEPPPGPDRASRPWIVPVVIGAVVLIVFAGFYFLDPLGLFGEAAVSGGDVRGDTAAVHEPDSLSSDSIPADTLPVPDTVTAVPEGTYMLLPLPEGVDSALSTPPASVESGPAPGGALLMPEEMDLLLPGLSSISASVPIRIDRCALFRTGEEGVVVLAVSVLHPEEDTKRYDLLRKLGAWLGPSPVSELAFYYAESQYHPVRTVSFTHERFDRLAGCVGPMDFQECASSTSDQVWAYLSGPAQTWMARFGD